MAGNLGSLVVHIGAETATLQSDIGRARTLFARGVADMQSQAAQNVAADENALAVLVSQSQGAIGIVQATQATNQLLALHARQQIQEQQLHLTQDRSAALEQARLVTAEARAREVRRRFEGNGARYTAQPINFYGF